MKRATYYNILGLDPGASKEEIRSSFRHLALKYHPDRNVAKKNAHAAFIAIHNAYKVLINEKARKDYDAYLANSVARTMPNRRPARAQDPRVQQAMSMFNSTLWDLEDLLGTMDNQSLSLPVGGITLYEYVLNLLGYLEDAILNERDRFSNFAAKQSRSKLHIDNYFYLLRMDIAKYLREVGKETDSSSGLRRIVSAETELIRSMEEIRRRL